MLTVSFKVSASRHDIPCASNLRSAENFKEMNHRASNNTMKPKHVFSFRHSASTGSFLMGNSVQLFNANTFDGTFTSITGTNIGGGLQWDTSTLASNGSITVIPEPSFAGILGLSALALLHRRKR